VGLAQLVRLLVVELTHPDSNSKFDMNVEFTVNYFLVGGDVSVTSETLLVIEFINLKIKLGYFLKVLIKIKYMYIYS
jgi:hypothetical protein